MGGKPAKPATAEPSADSKKTSSSDVETKNVVAGQSSRKQRTQLDTHSASSDDETIRVTSSRPIDRSTVTLKTTTISNAETAAKIESVKSVGTSSGCDVYWEVTAAIDFGTASSGFAFVFEDKPNDVHINKWILDSSEKEKAPTAVLLTEDKSFHSFGFTAESDYAQLCEHDKQNGWRYFHLFKMELYRQKKISRKTKLYDVENKPMSAIKVFSIVIGHLKNEILKAIRRQRRDVSDGDVMYVITVPAIWSDAAKQLMREAATSQEAGIADQQLRLVLEPEAASAYCSQQRVEKGKGADGLEFTPPSVGHVYSIVDIGGGTLDAATHEVVADNKIYEKHVARGNDIGGHHFNKKCLEFLEAMFGSDCFQKWKTTNCGDFLNLERDIEAMKRKVGQRDADVKLKFCHSLLEQHRLSSGGKKIEMTALVKDADNVILSSKKGFITLKHAFIRDVLMQIASAIENHITAIRNDDPSVKLIFLVGGLAKCPFIRQYITHRFRDCTVIVPKDPGLAVLKGAVLLGSRPQTISGRIARLSYGISTTADFNPDLHREEHKSTAEGKAKCDNLFEKLITRGQVLQFGQKFTTTTVVHAKLPETKQKSFTIYLFQSTQTSPMYTTDEGCSRLGGFRVHPPVGGWPDRCEQKVELIVGEAEFKLQVTDDLGRTYERKIDFLIPSQ